MVQCFEWMQLFWRQFVCEYLQVDSNGTKTSILSLPDDVMINILSRLPTQSVVECKLVISEWNKLSSTPIFAKIHLNNVTPLLLVEDRYSNIINWGGKETFLVLQGSGKNSRFKRVKLKFLEVLGPYISIQLVCSCDSFLIFALQYIEKFVIFNPITLENFSYCEKSHVIFGFFFHELDKNYKILIYELDDRAGWCNYYLYGLRKKDKRNLGSSYYRPVWYTGKYFENELAVVVCGVVFWMVKAVKGLKKSTFSIQCSESIMMYDLMTEKFIIMSHPGSTCTRCFFTWDCRLHEQIRLLEMDGRLCLCNVCENTIEVWILEDVSNWIWEKVYEIKLDCHYKHESCLWGLPIVGIHNGNLLLNWYGRGLFGFNLALNYSWKVKVPYNYPLYACSFYAIRYTSSFVSFGSGNISC